jgi:hydroxypyruvate isomerase
MQKFSANLGFLWPDRPLPDRIDAAAKAGFRAIELHWPYDVAPESVRDQCARLGLTLLGINTPPGDRDKGEFGLGAVPGRRDDFDAGFRQALDWGRIAGASAIHVMAGIIDPADRTPARHTLIDNLGRAAAMAPDMTLLLEAINPRDAPGYFYSTVGAAASVIVEVGVANIRLMFDVYHVGVSEGGVLDKLERFLPQIGHVQIAAVPSRTEPDTGEIAYRTVFRELDRLGYAGWVGCEYRPRGDTDMGLEWVAKLGVRL